MANLETVFFTPMRERVVDGLVMWDPDRLANPIKDLPQIFWSDGTPWSEVNHWALTKAQATSGGHIKTVTSLMKHLAAYASWLEEKNLDWRNFPMRFSDRTIVLFRGELIRQRDTLKIIASSTTTARMRAVIQFYRHAQVLGFVTARSPMWTDRNTVVRIHDAAGFERTMLLKSSELAIANVARVQRTLEDGLRPISSEHAFQLLEFSNAGCPLELHYMLSLGFLTGARLETISTLGIKNILDAIPDEDCPGIYRVRVGPSTGVKTKFNVSGDLVVPAFLMNELKGYANSMQRLHRVALASSEERGTLFLTIRGSPYAPQSFNRLMTDLRRKARENGLRFMEVFKFHQSRATFGTMLMGLALQEMSVSDAVAFVREAMLHKDEAVTLRYVRLLQTAPKMAAVHGKFAALFSGLASRDWSKFDA